MKRVRKLLTGLCLAAGGICLAKAAYIPVKGEVAAVLIERAWAKSQADGAAVLPWSWMDARPLVKLSAGRLDASEIVLDVSSGQALGFAPAHMQQTPKPGRPGLSVIAAHKNTHFAFLENIKIGDEISVEAIDGKITRFKVTQMQIVDKDASGIDINEVRDMPRIALVTCYPFSALSYGGPLRYVVYAEAVSTP